MYNLSETPLKFNSLKEIENQKCLINGRILRIRDKGKMLWIDILSNGEIYQTYFSEENPETILRAKKFTPESVVSLCGILKEKPNPNINITFGTHEIVVEKILYYSIAQNLPFNPHTDNVSEELSQKHRYLTLRNQEYYQNIKRRSEITSFVRRYFEDEGFLEIETPTLVRSTPEGARDFLVPSRFYPGEFYALPQSPQLYKQILMQSGFSKYFQIARCYRDEALRGDRQLEFTQIDIEACFYTQNEIIYLLTNMVNNLFQKFEINLVWNNIHYLTPHISYDVSMLNYGTDKPDLRFGLELQYVESGIFISVDKIMSGKERSNIYNWMNMFFSTIDSELKINFSIWNSNNFNKIKEENLEVYDKVKNEEEYTIFFLRDETVFINGALNYSNQTLKIAGELRNYIGRTFFIEENTPHAACWINDFPMFEWSSEENRFISVHHPFTRPTDVEKFKISAYDTKANAYDLVIDGVEVGGGSVRIHEPELQKEIFELLVIKNYEEQFGGLLNAYQYGSVPHAGLALGLDRLCTFFGESKKIGDYIAFPKNMKGIEHMLKSPTKIEEKQLSELKLKIDEK